MLPCDTGFKSERSAGGRLVSFSLCYADIKVFCTSSGDQTFQQEEKQLEPLMQMDNQVPPKKGRNYSLASSRRLSSS